MELATLQDLYVDELKDLYSAENQILKALPKMIKATSHPQLKAAFATHLTQTETHVKRLERVLEGLDETPKGKKCHGMEGVLDEGAELIKDKPERDVLDAGLISAAQHVEHYEMAGYGTVRTWAEKLGRAQDVTVLQQTLDEERETDQLLTKLAVATINVDADRPSGVDREVTLPGGSDTRVSRGSGQASASRPKAPSEKRKQN